MSDSNSRVGSTVDGRYHIERQLGQGGMGIVYRARDTKLDRTVALKFLASHLTLDAEAKGRFIQEAKAASALDHTNICAIYDISETPEGDLYIVMAHYEGETLGHRHREKPLSVDRCLSIGIQLARALEAAHEAGIIHRDLKPANVLLTDRDEVKLLDFGLAKLASSGGDLTKTGSTLGTAGYMSPEQIDGGDVDARADLFSFGALLYELLAGQKAFEGDSPISAAVAVLQTEPTPITQVRSDVPANVAALVGACLNKAVDQRPASASAVLAALGGTPAATLEGSVPASPPSALRWMIPAALGAIALWVVFVGPVLPIPFLGDSGGSTGPLDDNLVAVMPFQVAGSSDLDYLGEADLGRSRFLRAELEREIGDIEVAKRFYVGLDEPWSPWDSYWRPLVYDRLGSIAEAEGNEAEAIQYYSRIVELWRDADSEAATLRDVILERLDRLVGDERPSG